MHSPRQTINAIQRLESLLVMSGELQDYPDAESDLRLIRGECEFLLDEFEQEHLVAGTEEFELISRMEHWLLVLDTQCRPND